METYIGVEQLDEFKRANIFIDVLLQSEREAKVGHNLQTSH